MCGITGQVGPVRSGDEAWLSAALAALAHRGPDDEGSWTDLPGGVLLGHRRLSIVDLSPAGHQPFTSADGRWVVVFNGEVYGHRSLRRELEGVGVRFRSTSDTEVLVEAVARWGVVKALARVDGMFALAAWDRRRGELVLARDRLGEKPLFVQRLGGRVRFASELKALRAGGEPAPPVDRRALATYLRLGYVPAPWSIHEGITKVRPGTVEWFGASGAHLRTERYWDLPRAAGRGAAPPPDDELAELLAESVRLRLDADVPVGTFLSGGIDSSLVTAVAAAHAPGVRSFTIGFEDPSLDESEAAAAVAAHLGTTHTSLRVTGAEALAVVPRLPDLYDEPFADQSAIPTTLVAELARRDVTVVLSGDGGDELFGGYDRYRRLAMGGPLALLPRPMAAAVTATGRALSGGPRRLAGPGRTVERIGLALHTGGPEGLYGSLVSLWEDPGAAVPGGHGELPSVTSAVAWPRSPVDRRALVRAAMDVDLGSYLPDDILVKVDRATMAVALEGRVPLLDHRIVEWSRRVPAPDGRGSMKAPLRRLLARHLPAHLLDGPKRGFGAPVGSWLRGPLRPWAEELLAPDRLADGGLIDPTPVRRGWEQHLSGRIDRSYPLWAVLSFQAWRERWDV